METINDPKLTAPNYMQMAYLCFKLDCGTWYTQEAQISFAKYLEEHNKISATLDDLDEWKKLNHINT
jgi:hypothetical protein